MLGKRMRDATTDAKRRPLWHNIVYCMTHSLWDNNWVSVWTPKKGNLRYWQSAMRNDREQPALPKPTRNGIMKKEEAEEARERFISGSGRLSTTSAERQH